MRLTPKSGACTPGGYADGQKRCPGMRQGRELGLGWTWGTWESGVEGRWYVAVLCAAVVRRLRAERRSGIVAFVRKGGCIVPKGGNSAKRWKVVNVAPFVPYFARIDAGLSVGIESRPVTSCVLPLVFAGNAAQNDQNQSLGGVPEACGRTCRMSFPKPILPEIPQKFKRSPVLS
jgi:hypothetical protein